MMMIRLIFAICMAAVAVADYPYVNWTYPTGPIQRDNASNLTVHIGDTVDAAWTSTWVEDPDHGPWIEMHCGPGNLLLPQNGTFPFSMTGLNLNGWGLPMSCQFSVGYDKAGNMSAGFVLDEQTEAAAKTWGPTALPATATTAPTSSQTGAKSATTSNASSSATGNAPATPSATPAGGGGGGGGGLSPGAAAGVGVSCTIIGLGLIGLLIWVIRRWRKRWAIAVTRRSDSGAKEKQGQDMSEGERNGFFAKPEMNAEQTRYEMPEGYAMPKELAGRTRHYELSGAERRRELEG